jgi:hypothetical protein
VNKTAKQRLSQSEIDSLVQQAASKKQLGSGPGLPAPRPQKQEVKPAVDSKRQSEAVAPVTDAVAGKPGQPDNQRQTPAKTAEQARGQQPQSVPAAKKEGSQPAAKATETVAKDEDDPGHDEKAAGPVVVTPSAGHNPLELKQYFWLGGEDASDLQPDRVMTVLNKKLFRLG